MSPDQLSEKSSFVVTPIGRVHRSGADVNLQIAKKYTRGLKQADQFSHILVFWWHGPESTSAGNKPARRTGTNAFAIRSNCGPTRPNPLGLTVCEIMALDPKTGEINLRNIDAPDGAPVLDLKAYFPSIDRIKSVRVPESDAADENWLPQSGIVSNGRNEATFDAAARSEVTPCSLSQIGSVVRRNGHNSLEIRPAFREHLAELNQYSHLYVVWWFHKLDRPRFRRILQCSPPYENAPLTGVFASRSPVRPNPIGITTVRLLEVDPASGSVIVSGLDAFPQTPVLDLKPYVPRFDRVKTVRVPAYLRHWPQWVTEPEGTSLSGAEVDPDHLLPADIDRLRVMQPTAPAALQQEAQSISVSDSLAGTNSLASSQFDTGSLSQISPNDSIRIRGAHQHNLQNVSVTIPRSKLTVITGVSGSGKSSLAFDTLHAEGQRRYMQNLSVQARQLLDRLERPRVDHIDGLCPTVAIEQKTLSRNPRSTVGTVTEVTNYLRLLFARIGTRHCDQCGRAVRPVAPQEILENLTGLPPGTHFHLSSFYPDHPTSTGAAFVVPEVGTVFKGSAGGPTDEKTSDAAPDGSESIFKTELYATIAQLMEKGRGRVAVAVEDQERLVLSRNNECPRCQRVFFTLTASHFSTISADGMCSDCNGLGVKMTVDPEKIVPHTDRSLLDEASPWWGNLRKHRERPSGNWMKCEVLALAQKQAVNLERPWQDLPRKFRHAALYGTGDETVRFAYQSRQGRSGEIVRPVGGAVNHIQRLLGNSNGKGSRDFYLQFVTDSSCPACRGERLADEGRFAALGGTRFPVVSALTIGGALDWTKQLRSFLNREQRQISHELRRELQNRLESLCNVGLHYLPLDRPVPTLSGGESQRIRLSGQLSAGLTGLTYILDEPSVGLHPRDQRALLDLLARLKQNGNTVVVVEHDADTMRAADWLIDMGPGAGSRGGQVVAAGIPSAVMQNPASLTGRYLQGEQLVTDADGSRRRPHKWVTVHKAHLHNLKSIDIAFPLGVLTCVTGVSGSGKSSLVSYTLYPALAHALKNGGHPGRGSFEAVAGLAAIDKVINITQAPIGRSPRSNPATYVDLFDKIRHLFAGTHQARQKKFGLGRFSFNSVQGRCNACKGLGKRRVEMLFLADVWVTCKECRGQRFNSETLAVAYNGKTIAEVLALDVAAALDFFADQRPIVRILTTLSDVGLSYIRLGQSALTLSGGEAQRIKLAKELSRPDTGRTMFMLDEPTSGLHFDDIRKLLYVIRRLVEAGNSVIVIEHNLDVIRAADWIIDLGPEGGEAGGLVVAQGPPETITAAASSMTGRFLSPRPIDEKGQA